MASIPDLASMRQARGITLGQISSVTKIGLPYLEAIERLDFQHLPGGVYDTNYIRQYARAIEYDEWDLLHCYDEIKRPAEEEQPAAKGGRFAAFAAPLLRLFAR